MTDPICQRCNRVASDHEGGDCPDGAGSFTFQVNPEVFAFLDANPTLQGDDLVRAWVAHVRELQLKERKPN